MIGGLTLAILGGYKLVSGDGGFTLEILQHLNRPHTYLSQISQIISVEKNLSCGEISEYFRI